MAYKLIALDLDDTLMRSDATISPRTARALKAAEEHGAYVVLATGRSFAGVRRYYDELGLDSPAIVLTGGQVVGAHGKGILYHCYLENDDALAILQYAKTHDFHAQIYEGDNFCFVKNSQYSKIYEDFYGFPGMVIPDLYERKEISTAKILFIDEIKRIFAAQEETQKLFPHVNIMRSKPYYLEFLNPDAHKGRALQFLTEYLGLKREEVIACGDSQIDSTMLQYAGLGVAVENALPEIKEIADYITASNDEDGVARVVEKFILEE